MTHDMAQETRNCQSCKNPFIIEPDDFAFYEKMKVPPPTFCPQCRFVRRLLNRNERSLHKRKCDLCGQEKILIFRSDSPLKVYCYQCWFSDKWDGAAFATEYDLAKPFAEQWKGLFAKVPRIGVIQQGMNVQSEYTNRASDNRNCYLIFAAADNENCAYGTGIWNSKDSLDGYSLHKSEQCYEVTDCFSCNNLKFSRECNSCADSAFLLNCRNCTNCFGCVNLRNKQYCIFNVQYSREEYLEKTKKFNLGSRAVIAQVRQQMQELAKKQPVPALVAHQCVNVDGNWLENDKDVHTGWSSKNVENGRYIMGITTAKDVMDYTYWGHGSELIYNSSSVGRQCNTVLFSNESWDQLARAQYCMNCHNSSDLFGCIGLRNKQYCILNKQYTKEEYETLVPKIIEQMNGVPYRDAQGREYRYGDFLPIDAVPFGYNETIAQEFFPLTKEKAVAQGYRWTEPDTKSYAITMKASDIPDLIDFADEGMLQKVIGCAHEGTCTHQCTTAFRLIPDEWQFYRKHNIALPNLCPNCRHYERLAVRNPMQLWPRTCQCVGLVSENGSYTNAAQHQHGDKICGNAFSTSYAPNRPEIVYCESCYNAEVV